MRMFCVLITFFLASASVNADEWSEWKFVEEKDGVTLKYRTKPYKDKTMVAWVAKNTTDKKVNIKFEKIYTTSAEEPVTRTGRVSQLSPGNVFDPSPDFIPGTVSKVEVSLSVN
jgi:hypothetical protein